MVIDLPSDKGLAHFHAVSRILNLPEFVKQADFTQQVETNELPTEAFADVLDRKFPIHTKAAAYLSYAYFLSQQDGLDKQASLRCAQGFDRAREYWGLHEEFEQTKKAMVKKAEPNVSEFAMVVDTEAGQERFFPVNTPYEIIKSAEALVVNRHRFDYALRSQGAKNIVKAAAKAGLPFSALPETLHKMAGCGITTKEAAMLELTKRWDKEARPSLAEPLHACINALGNLESGLLGGEVCEKVAAIIDRYDRAAGKPSFPEDVLFAFTKQAAEKLANNIVTMIDGTSYWLPQLEKASEAFDVLGQDIVKGIKDVDGSLNLFKVAELIDTLPRMDAEILKEALTTFGIWPYTIDKNAMVKMVVETVQPPTLTTIHTKIEKRADILTRLEAEDPLVKRALDVVRRLKTAESKCDEDTDEGEESKTPRGIRGLFINKAPNKTETKPVS